MDFSSLNIISLIIIEHQKVKINWLNEEKYFCFLFFSDQIVSNQSNVNDTNSINANLNKTAETWIIIPGSHKKIKWWEKQFSTKRGANAIFFDWTYWPHRFLPCIVQIFVERVPLHVVNVTRGLINAGITQNLIKYVGRHNLGGHIVCLNHWKMDHCLGIKKSLIYKWIKSCFTSILFHCLVLGAAWLSYQPPTGP